MFAASWCYAKITPALLHRREIAGRCCERAEAAGRKLEFEMSDFLRVIARGVSGGGIALDGIKLSKACPMLEPLKQATRCLIFDLKLFDVSRLGLGGLDPFLHLGHRHNGAGIGSEPRL